MVFLLLLRAQLEVLRALDRQLLLELTLGALHAQHDLLRRLRFLVKDGLLLATVALLLHVVAALALRVHTVFALLVLRDFVQGVLLAVLAFAERTTGLRNVDHG